MMRQTPQEVLEEALERLELPKLITKEDIKRQYRALSKKHHPDAGGSAEVQEALNVSYTFLMKYIEEFRYTFDEKEIANQFPGAEHAQRFTP